LDPHSLSSILALQESAKFWFGNWRWRLKQCSSRRT
jgi:hypothetical protein